MIDCRVVSFEFLWPTRLRAFVSIVIRRQHFRFRAARNTVAVVCQPFSSSDQSNRSICAHCLNESRNKQLHAFTGLNQLPHTLTALKSSARGSSAFGLRADNIPHFSRPRLHLHVTTAWYRSSNVGVLSPPFVPLHHWAFISLLIFYPFTEYQYSYFLPHFAYLIFIAIFYLSFRVRGTDTDSCMNLLSRFHIRVLPDN